MKNKNIPKTAIVPFSLFSHFTHEPKMCTSSRISLSFYLGSTNVFDEEKKIMQLQSLQGWQ